MKNLKHLSGVLAVLLGALPCRASIISFTNFTDSTDGQSIAGVHLKPTGPTQLPMLLGLPEVVGISTPSINSFGEARYYSGVGKVDHPATTITLDVKRENNSGWNDVISLTAFDNGKRVASKTVDIAPLGESTQITLSAPAIDRFTWGGNGWVYHPYLLEGLQVTVNGVSSTPKVSDSPPEITPSVGGTLPTPEPASVGMLLAAGGYVMASRRRHRSL